MGISVSASVGVLFISLIISSVVIWEAQDTKDGMVNGARDRNLYRMSDFLSTSVTLGHISHNQPPANRVNITAINNGSTSLDMRYTDIYLNGSHYQKNFTLYDFNNVEIPNSYILGPNDRVNITINSVHLTPPIHVKLSFHNGFSLYSVIN